MSNIEFRRAVRFVGTKKNYKLVLFLQYREKRGEWWDIMDVTRCLSVDDGILAYPWETPKDEANYKSALEYDHINQFR